MGGGGASSSIPARSGNPFPAATADFIYSEPANGDNIGGDGGDASDDFASLPISELPTTATSGSDNNAGFSSSPSPPPLPRRNGMKSGSTKEVKDDEKEVRLSDLLTATPDHLQQQSSSQLLRPSASIAPTKLETVREHQRSSVARPPTVRPSSLQQLQALDLFRSPKQQQHPNNKNSSDSESFMLETEQYVRQMKRRRGEVLTRIDGPSAGNRLRRKVGYEIERRLVKATLARKRSGKKKKRKSEEEEEEEEENPFRKIMWWTLRRSEAGRRASGGLRCVRRSHLKHRRYHRHHRFCLKCVTSSFAALFRLLANPVAAIRHSANDGSGDSDDGDEDDSFVDVDRTPTPKMLLGPDGRLQWPVFQFGGRHGTGMLISARDGAHFRRAAAVAAAGRAGGSGGGGDINNNSNGDNVYSRQPGRENFSLGGDAEERRMKKDLFSSYGELGGVGGVGAPPSLFFGDDDSRLVGWLQVSNGGGGGGGGNGDGRHRHQRRRRRHYLPVVDPAPLGPFRKAPWHGNVHVLKF